MDISDILNNLEDYGSPRAEFRNISQEDLRKVASVLVIARSQAKNPENPDCDLWNTGTYRDEMECKKNLYMYYCGCVGIDFDEANYIWWNAVYDGVAPVDRERVV